MTREPAPAKGTSASAAASVARRTRLVDLSLLGLLAVLWGSSYLWIKLAVPTVPPLTLIAARVLIAAVVLVVVMRAMGYRLPKTLTAWRQFTIQAVLNAVAPWTLLAWGQQSVDSSLAGVLNSTSPIFVVLLTLAWTRHEAMGPRRVAGALIGLAGVTTVIGLDAVASLGASVVPQLAVLFGASLYAGAAIYGTRFSSTPPVVTAAGTMLAASALLLPASVLVEHPWTLTPAPQAVLAIAILGAACTALALLVYFRLVRNLGSLGTASQAYLRSSVSVVLGTLVLGETLTPLIALGLAATIFGVAMINWRR